MVRADFYLNLGHQATYLYLVQTHTNSLHPTIQSDPDSQTAPHQAHNT